MNARSEYSIAPAALYQQVAERLRARIFAHQLPPGSWLDEQSLAQEYGISRTPLREALKVLAAEGLVMLKPRRGCYVTELAEEDLDEIFPVIALLEGRCAALATQRANAADLQHLGTIHEQLEECARKGDADGFFEVNHDFHVALQELAGNRWLSQLIDETRKLLKLTRRDSLRLKGRLKQSLAEHRAILKAIRQRDESQAGRLMHEHLLSGRAALSKLHTSAP
ncbi:MAG: GntR family transcriptional regulator [Betaproteobacteria bacterium]|nr:GntR family transcriptional regulator [Betaproteobacteria bacterium]